MPLHLCSLLAVSQTVLVVIGVVAALALIAGGLWLVHFFTVKAARKELDQYKEQVVTLSDKIDALKERCKLLPHLDQDFKVPMAGETLTTYTAVGEQLERHRGEWLKLMDVWEQAQSLLESETMIGSSRAREVRRRVRGADAPAVLAALIRDCETPLDRIERAHEEVAGKLTAYEQATAQLATHQQALQAATVSIDPYQSESSAAKSLVDQSRTLLTADPLGSLRCLEGALARIAQLNQLAAKILEHVRTAQSVAERMEHVTRTASDHRAQGLLLREAQANPDPLLAEARQQHSVGWHEMNRGNEPVAAAALTKAISLIDQAQQAIDQHLAARSRCESEIPARRSDNLRLEKMQSVVRGQQLELERDFAADSWLPVADHLSKAQSCLASAQQQSAAAEQQASTDVQNYLQAGRLLAQAAENQKLAENALTAIGQKLRELVEVRIKCQSQIGELRVHADRVARLLHSNTADRVRANERFRSANAALERLVQDTRMPRPDWPRLSTNLRDVHSDLERAEKMAREDLQLAQQAAAEISETETLLREARTFQELGFTPDLHSAEAQLAKARSLLSAQEYEETIRVANAAEQAVREARQLAMAQAQRRRQELEAQRRAEEAARQDTQEPLLERERIV